MSNSNKKPLSPGDAMLLRAMHQRLGAEGETLEPGKLALLQDLYRGLESRVAKELGRKLLGSASLKPERRASAPRRTFEAS